MTITCSFFDHVKYAAQEFINRVKDFTGNGVLNPSTDFALSSPATPGMTMNVAAGTAWVDGYRIGYDANPVQTLTFAAADPTYPRIDLVEVGYSGTGLQGIGQIKVVTGVPAASPIQPSPDAGYVGLFAVSVAAGVTSVSPSNATDLRAQITGHWATEADFAAHLADIKPHGIDYNIAASGYYTLPGGLILQWMTVNVTTANTPQNVLFPVVFPNAVYKIYISDVNAAASYSATSNGSTTGYTVISSSAGTKQILAIGK